MNRNSNVYINHLDDVKSKWFAVKFKVKTEKFVVNLLLKKGIQAYVPTVLEVKNYKTKVSKIYKPLISSYIFVKVKKQDYIPVLRTNYVYDFLKLHQNLRCIPEKEMNILKLIVWEDIESSIYKDDLIVGQYVEVISGNLTGLKGVIIKKARKKSFIVEFASMGFNLEDDISKEVLKSAVNTQRA